VTRPRPWFLCLTYAATFLACAWANIRRGDPELAVFLGVMAGVNLGMLVERHRP
jgi:hypothetical protein